MPKLRRNTGRLLAATAAVAVASPALAQLSGELGAHDPSTLIKDGSTYRYLATGQGIASRSSSDKVNWSGGPAVFGAPPAWTTQAVPSFTGFFWAPDVAYFNGLYHLYYSVSSWGTIDSAIGLATTPSLASPTWTDRGKVVQSDATWDAGPNTDTTSFNAIDPSVLVDDTTGKVWMAFGSYSSGILVTEVNPSTGKRLNTSTLSGTLVANNAPGGGWGSSIEGSALVKRGSYYYLFVNYGGCCAGVDSTYDVRVGRSTSPTGPFLDKNGVNMVNGGGTLFLDDDGKMIGPGHFSYFSEAGQDSFGYHYYNGDANGAPTYGLRNLYWTADAWPSYAAVNPDWTGTINGNWSMSANWSAGGAPNGVGHVANFGSAASGRYAVAIDGGGKTASTLNFTGNASYTIGNVAGSALTLDAAAGDSATINVQSGTHTIAAPINASDRLGVNVLGGNRLNLSGAVNGTGLTKYGHGTLALNATATFSEPVLLRWGLTEVNGAVTANSFTSVGPGFAEGGVLMVRGTGSFTANADLNIGDTGNAVDAATGWLEIHDNASVTVNSAGGFFVGSGFFANTRAVGTVTQTGGTLTANGNFDGAFIIGGRGSSLAVGTYNLSGGTVNANTNVQAGGRGAGTVNQTGGTFNAGGFLSIGRHAGGTGSWTISGGTLNLTNPARTLIVGEDGAGTLSVSGGGQVQSAGTLRLGSGASGSGIVNLTGGTLTAPLIARGGGSGTLNFDGGTLRAGASSTTFMQGLTAAYVKSGGAVVDTQAFNVTVAQPLLHDPGLGAAALDGGLTKLGAGTLTLTGANTYTGGTTVRAGTLRISAGTTGVATPVGQPDVNVQLAPANGDAGAMIVSGGVVNADRVIIAGNGSNNAGGVATLTQSGGTIDSSLWFAVGSVGSGTFNMTGGTLNQNRSGGSQLEVAVFGSGHSSATLGGTAQVNIFNGGNFSVGVVNNSGSGTVNQNGGSVTFYSDAGTTVGGGGNVILGQFSPTGAYTYNLNGGTLTTGSVTRSASAASAGATGILNLNGGTLKAARNGADLVSNLSGARLGSGGAIIDTNGLSVTLSQALLHDPALGAASDGGLTKTGAGTLSLSASASVYSGPTNVSAGALVVADTGTRNNVLKGGALSIAAAARLDLKNNKLITTTAVGAQSGGVYDGVSGQVQRASNGGAWDQPGLTTSMPDAVGGLTSIGVASGAQVLGLGATETGTFAGQAITGASTIAMYTYAGDANLDGFISGDDYAAIDFNVAVPDSSGWYNGDFNWDGIISGDDYAAIDLNIVAQGAPFPTGGTMTLSAVAVPEPASAGLLAAAAGAIICRRRRRFS